MKARTRRRRRASWVQREERETQSIGRPSAGFGDRAMSSRSFRRQSTSACLRPLPFSASPVCGRYSSNASANASERVQCVPPLSWGSWSLQRFQRQAATSKAELRPCQGTVRRACQGLVPGHETVMASLTSLPRVANPGPLRPWRFDAFDALLRPRSSERRGPASLRSWGSIVRSCMLKSHL